MAEKVKAVLNKNVKKRRIQKKISKKSKILTRIKEIYARKRLKRALKKAEKKKNDQKKVS